MIEFLKKGKELNNVHMGMSVDAVYSELGEPDEIIGDNNSGYLHYGEYRYGYDIKRCICEMSIEFNRLEKKYKLKELETEKYGVKFYESFTISNKSKIHKIIRFLNYIQLRWESNNDGDKDYLKIKIDGGPFLIFNLQNGVLLKISVMDGHQ
ncbi:MAG: hypothetical protein COZ75_03560 [Flavobacteriaceae bacterium CG_4_8_14_3_um_filter_34_10]|nr:MAG: hypothetical protein COS19_13755 [Flavobacteriaceae bacterium CG02_land_8_20_14_3_00_34_13]PIX10060.1 MAG: hypothetical protein COZ75_03560 [Flavobacteriaceae bacterium CG_4_8_14_3_um_filter_34_10]